MVKRLILSCACVLVAYPAAASSIVTWEGAGLIRVVHGINALDVVPPAGTPVSYTLSFDPTQSHPTMSGSPGCVTVPVSASVNIGGYTYNTSPGSLGFTSALLPGTSCTTSGPSGHTQFSLHTLQSPPDTPWPLDFGQSLMILDYQDLIVRDAFPSTPPTDQASLFLTGIFLGAVTWTFDAPVSLQAVEQPTAVPEPATMTMFGLGLAALARKTRRRKT